MIDPTHRGKFDRRTPAILPKVLVFGVVAISLLLASCDVVNPIGGITLPTQTASFRFEINTDGVDPGQTVQVNSEESVNLAQALDEAGGYTKAEVLSATVTRVELERINPTGVNLSILEEALVAFTASGVSTKTIATATSLPSSPSATLPVSSSPDVTSFVIAPSFRGALTIVPESVPDGILVLRATVTFRIEVEGV